MSVTLTYESLTSLINALSSSAATAENLIDQAINMIVSASKERLTISVLAGDAGSKTGTYSQAEAGAILFLAAQLYSQIYLTSGGSSKNVSLQGVSLGQSSNSSSGAGSLQELAKNFADQLIIADESVDPPIYVSNDPVSTS